jgi:hypothetical protein
MWSTPPTVMERLEGRFGGVLQRMEPDPPAEREMIEFRRLGHLV